MGFEAIVCGISIGIVWKFYGILWYFHKISLGFHDISIGSPSDICGMAFLWDFQICFYDLSMGLTLGTMWDYSRISLWFVCDVHVVSVIFLSGFCGIPMGFPWYACDISLGLVRDVNCKSVEPSRAPLRLNVIEHVKKRFEIKISWRKILINWKPTEGTKCSRFKFISK